MNTNHTTLTAPVATSITRASRAIFSTALIACLTSTLTLTGCGRTHINHIHRTTTLIQHITPTSQDPNTLNPEQREQLTKECTDLVDLVETQQYLIMKLGPDALKNKISGYQKSFNTYAHKHYSFANNPIAMDIAYRSLGHPNDILIHRDIKNFCSTPIFNEVLQKSPNHLGLGGRGHQEPNWEQPVQ